MMQVKTLDIRLREYMDRDDGWGNEMGKEVFSKLMQFVSQNDDVTIFRVSLSGIRRTDVSFPRESVVKLAHHFRRRKGFCLFDAERFEILENWNIAALKLSQVLTYWKDEKASFIGCQSFNLQDDIKNLLRYVISVDSVVASQVANALNKRLYSVQLGLNLLECMKFILKGERIYTELGLEDQYFRIR